MEAAAGPRGCWKAPLLVGSSWNALWFQRWVRGSGGLLGLFSFLNKVNQMRSYHPFFSLCPDSDYYISTKEK